MKIIKEILKGTGTDTRDKGQYDSLLIQAYTQNQFFSKSKIPKSFYYNIGEWNYTKNKTQYEVHWSQSKNDPYSQELKSPE